jgi:nitronate monooxygenase/enoyl-[acyl-carrier protein] reductase II
MLRTAFLDTWEGRPQEMADVAGDLSNALFTAIRAGNGHDYFPYAGQSAGLVTEVLPVAEIVRRTISQAEDALKLVESYRAAADA